MALVRVYCGLASVQPARPADQRHSPGSWLTAAVVDDSGRLLEVCDLGDDPTGYAQLSVILAERSTRPADVAIAADSDDHLVTTFLMAAGWPLAFADDDSVDDYAERFADDESVEEMQSPPAERRAIGLARALQAGALSAVALPAPREVAALKPVLAAHAALAVGRQAAAVALREVLRELYPAALRAYPDPAEAVPLAVLDALPEPGMVASSLSTRGRDAANTDGLAAQLASTGVADEAAITEALTALRVAVAETPRRNGVAKGFTTAVAETVRHAVAAVRAYDAAQAALITALAEQGSTATSGTQPRVVRPRASDSSGAPARVLRAVRDGTAEHPTVRVAGPRRNRPTAAPVSTPPLPRRPAAVANPPANRPAPPGLTPIVPLRGPAVPTPSQPVSPAQPAAAAYFPPTPGHHLPPGVEPFQAPMTAGHGYGAAEYTGNGYGAAEYAAPASRPAAPTSPAAPPPGSRANWPLQPGGDAGTTGSPANSTAADSYGGSGAAAGDLGRVVPPWQADDLREPPPLRLVDPPPLTDPALRLVDPPPMTDPALRHNTNGGGLDSPGLRLVDDSALTGPLPNGLSSEPPVPADESDADLLIFTATRSAWFSGGGGQIDWTNPNDAAWRAAEQAARPSYVESTSAGLPKRVPQANLVPGAPLAPPDRPLHIVRDPARIAASTAGYFQGWRRGQEIGGFAVGGRPGRESPHGWEFNRDHADGYDGNSTYAYQSAAYPSR